VGTTSAALQVEAANNGGSALIFNQVTVSSPFTIASDSCLANSLPADAECQVMVAFVSSQAGPVAGTLTFVDGAGTQTVALTGIGTAAPTDTLGTASLTFPATSTGLTSTPQTVSLTNAGGLPLTSIAVSTSGPFQALNGCGTQLAAGAICSISVTFAPASAGAQTGTLTVADILRTQTVSLAGTGVAQAALSVSPPSLSFAAEPVGVASAPSLLTVTNTGGVPMANVGFQISGANASSFSTGTTTCGATLANGSSCTVQVIFTPVATGGITATLTISSSTRNVTPVPVPLSGAGGMAAGIAVTPNTITFPETAVGTITSATSVTISNTGTSALTSLALTIPPGFLLASNTCAATLSAGASCTVGVEFGPSAAGEQTGVLAITSSSVPVGAQVSMSGMGFDFTLAASGSTTQAVASGQTANYLFVITPMEGAQGAFTFQCGTLPANALCLFSPASETVNAGATGNVTVQISTGQSGSSARSAAPFSWGAVPIACGLILLPLAFKRRRWNALWLSVVLVVLAGVTSCTSSGGGGGGSGGGGSGSPTPAGTYSIPVTVTSTGIGHSMTVTLKVN
jgi:hypothetical protein